MKKYLALSIVALAGIGVGATVIGGPSGADAQGTPPRTVVLKESAKGSKFKFVDVKPFQKQPDREPPSMGDGFVFYAPLLDTNGKRVGELDAKCTVMKPGRNEIDLCEGVAAVTGSGSGNGNLFLAARVVDGQDVSGAITGGTGAFANARGTFTSVGDPATDTFTFTQ